ncbi:MAG: LysM peptidoglycan-binding domain-containing protein [Euzebyaceae bacterium]|nr:LysM peptidoglycan-binding domain-containing protein [Euzebyaceae bacterium]
MDDDYQMEDDYGPRVLWGRVVLFVIAALLFLFLGRCTAGGGVPSAQFASEQARVAALASENAALQQQLDVAEARQAEGGGGSGGGGGGGQSREPTEDAEATEEPVEQEGLTYTIQLGDTLAGIAEEFYGDATQYEIIAEANDIDSSTPLREGDELIIPPEQ